MFDENYGIAVFSAYKLTQQLVQAGFPGQDAKPDFYPTPGNLFKCQYTKIFFLCEGSTDDTFNSKPSPLGHEFYLLETTVSIV